jgi:hypothetical protein
MPGLDTAILNTVDHQTAIARIQHDIRTDFIWAPHLAAIFQFCGDRLWDQLRRDLRGGSYEPELPISIRVPKPGGFTRPGAILNPEDRLVYQILADLCAPTVEQHLDRQRVFSNIFQPEPSTGAMFASQGDGWKRMQSHIRTMAEEGGHFVVGDIAHYFERVPQHHLINLIRASGAPPEVIRLLEEVFLAFQERDSFGIIQGVYPSDLLGNFYLSDLDAQCELRGWQSARFVDDFYIHFDQRRSAERGLSDIIDALRRDGLHLNEHKSGIRDAEDLIWEETELDRLLDEAWDEVVDEHDGFHFEYGFTTEWDDDPDEEQLRVVSIERIYASIEEYPHAVDKIERFCLPILRTARSQVAIDRAIKGVRERPHLARLYLSYLAELARHDADISSRVQQILIENDLSFDYQRLFLISALLNATGIQREATLKAVRLLQDRAVHPSVRAVAAIFAARHGTPQHRRSVRTSYEDEASAYVKGAILYASMYFTGPERKTCIRAWGGHNLTNSLIAEATRQISS